MMRTQVYLPRPLYQAISNEANRQRKPRAEVIRELLSKSVAQTTRTNSGDALLRLAEVGRKFIGQAPADLSDNIDRYLYQE
jgi:metal-responsive CopG/Arc/MetJ family transcriptional regulator